MVSFHSAWWQAYEGQPWRGPFLVPGGQALEHGEREAAMTAPPPVHQPTVAPCFYGRPGFLHKHSWLQISFLLSPQAVSLQPMTGLSPGLLSNPHVPAPSPHVHWWTHIPVWGAQGCGTYCQCRSKSVLSATDWSFHPPLTASDAPLLSELISPLVRELLWTWEHPLFLSSNPRGADLFLLPLLFFFHPTLLCGDLSCPF